VLLWIKKISHAISPACFRYELHQSARALTRNRPAIEIGFRLDDGSDKRRIDTVIGGNRIDKGSKRLRHRFRQHILRFPNDRRSWRRRVIDEWRSLVDPRPRLLDPRCGTIF